MKPIKLKELLEQAKDPETQCIEIMEDYTLSAKTVFEGIVKDVPENMLGKSNKKEWEEYYRFEPYKHWTVKEWLIAEGKMMFYISPVKQKSRPTFSDEPARKLSTEETQ